MKKLLAAMTSVGILVSAVAYADVIEDRRAIMKQRNGASIGALARMVRGESPYDQEVVMNALRTMHEGMEGFADLFPPGSETGDDTIASPKIWEDMEGFRAAIAAFQEDLETAIEAEPVSVEEFTPLFQEIGANCNSCHEEYRLQRQ